MKKILLTLIFMPLMQGYCVQMQANGVEQMGPAHAPVFDHKGEIGINSRNSIISANTDQLERMRALISMQTDEINKIKERLENLEKKVNEKGK